MKMKTVVLSCMAVVLILFVGYGYSAAKPKIETTNVKIGVVNIRKVFRDSKKNAKYRSDALAEQVRLDSEIQTLQKEFETQRAGLNALKPGSSDYLVQVRELLQKQAQLEAERQFNNQQRGLKDQQWTEELYKQILRVTRGLAEQKGLDLVFEKGEVEFPVANADELMLTLSTHKLLYSEGCQDITDEVVKRLDAE